MSPTKADPTSNQHPHADSHPESDPNADADATSLAEPSNAALEQINLVLDTIRLNLSNIARTWGRDSVQYASAREIMQSYLAENVERARNATVRARGERNGGDEALTRRADGDGGRDGDVEMDMDLGPKSSVDMVMDLGIEELMRRVLKID